MITIYRGAPGQGKTYTMSEKILYLIERNKYWFKKGWTKNEQRTDILRPIATNMTISDWVKELYPAIIYWDDLQQLVELRGADVIFDDMSNYLDAQRWADTPDSVKKWLRYHEHYGVDVYGNAQDFMTIDPSVRRLTTELYDVKKVMGSHRPGLNKPPTGRVWGIIGVHKLDIEGLKMQTNIDEASIPNAGWPRYKFIRKKVCSVFDTNQNFSVLKWPMLQHIERHCNDPECKYNLEPMVKHV